MNVNLAQHGLGKITLRNGVCRAASIARVGRSNVCLARPADKAWAVIIDTLNLGLYTRDGWRYWEFAGPDRDPHDLDIVAFEAAA